MRAVKRLGPALFLGKPVEALSCPTCGNRIYRLIIWSLVLFFISIFFGVKLLSPLLKKPPAPEAQGLTRSPALPPMAGDSIRLHMGKQDVLRAWGPPERVIISQSVDDFKRETWHLSGGRRVTFNMIGTVESFEEPSSSGPIFR